VVVRFLLEGGEPGLLGGEPSLKRYGEGGGLLCLSNQGQGQGEGGRVGGWGLLCSPVHMVAGTRS